MKEIKESELKEVTKGNKKVVVDFWANWCNPCKMLSPILEEVSEELKEDFDFFKLNVDNATGTAIELNVYSIPTIIVFENGKEIARNVGFLNKNDLKKWLKTQN